MFPFIIGEIIGSAAGSALSGLFGGGSSSSAEIPQELIDQITGATPPRVELPGVPESRFLNTLLGDLGFVPGPSQQTTALQKQQAEINTFKAAFQAHLDSKAARKAAIIENRSLPKGQKKPLPPIVAKPKPITIPRGDLLGPPRKSGIVPLNPNIKIQNIKRADRFLNLVQSSLEKSELGDTPIPRTPEEEARREALSTEQDSFLKIREALFSSLGLEKTLDEQGNITGFKRVEGENEGLRNEVEEQLLERQLTALRGDLPIAPGLLRDLREQEQTLRESLIRQLGAGFETSSPGIEALANFNLRRNEILEAARRGDIAQAGQLATEAGVTASNLLTQKLSNIFQVPGFGLQREGFNLNKKLSDIGILQGQQNIGVEERRLNAQLLGNLLNQQIAALGQVASQATAITPGTDFSTIGALFGGGIGDKLSSAASSIFNLISPSPSSSGGGAVIPRNGGLIPGISKFIAAI